MEMQKSIVGVIIVGIFLVIGLLLFSTMEDNFRSSTTGTLVNESVTSLTEVPSTLSVVSNSVYNHGLSCSSTAIVINATGYTTITSANYTLASDCTIKHIGADTTFNHTAVKVTYTVTYNAATSSSNASSDLITSLNNGSSWLTIIVVVMFAVIVLGMLSSGLGKAASGSGEAAYAY